MKSGVCVVVLAAVSVLGCSRKTDAPAKPQDDASARPDGTLTTIADAASPDARPTTTTLREIEGVWSAPVPGFHIVSVAATNDLAFVGGTSGKPVPSHGGPDLPERPDVRAVQLEKGVVRVRPMPVVPMPPKTWGPVEPLLALDASKNPAQLVASLVETQGGSWGLVVYPSVGQPNVERIDSPLDSDIPFGRNPVLRGDELFTAGAQVVFHYRRESGLWHRRTDLLQLRSSDDEIWWSLALSPDGNTVVVPVNRKNTYTLEVFSRVAGGGFGPARSVPLPVRPSGVVFAGATLVVGFLDPAPDGSALWVYDSAIAQPTKRITIPLASNGTAVHHFDVAEHFAVVSKLDEILIIDTDAGRPTAKLQLPPRPNQRSLPRTAIGLGGRVVAVAEDRVGIYDPK